MDAKLLAIDENRLVEILFIWGNMTTSKSAQRFNYSYCSIYIAFGNKMEKVTNSANSSCSIRYCVTLGSSFLEHSRSHDDVIKWRHFPRYRPFVRGMHRSSVNSPHKGQWREALIFPLILAWTNSWVNNREAGDLRHYFADYDANVMRFSLFPLCQYHTWFTNIWHGW